MNRILFFYSCLIWLKIINIVELWLIIVKIKFCIYIFVPFVQNLIYWPYLFLRTHQPLDEWGNHFFCFYFFQSILYKFNILVFFQFQFQEILQPIFKKKIFHIFSNVLIYFQPIHLSFPMFLCYQNLKWIDIWKLWIWFLYVFFFHPWFWR